MEYNEIEYYVGQNVLMNHEEYGHAPNHINVKCKIIKKHKWNFSYRYAYNLKAKETGRIFYFMTPPTISLESRVKKLERILNGK